MKEPKLSELETDPKGTEQIRRKMAAARNYNKYKQNQPGHTADQSYRNRRAVSGALESILE